MYAVASWWNVAAARPGPTAVPDNTHWCKQYTKATAAAIQKQRGMEACLQAETKCSLWTSRRSHLVCRKRHQRYRCVRPTLAGDVTSSIQQHPRQQSAYVAPAQDQAECQTCTAFAVAAADETAVASALQVDVDQCSISTHALFFCAQDGPSKSCDTGWSLENALEQLKQRGRSLPTASCMPYRPDITGDRPAAAVCKGNCNNPSMHATKGQFSTQQITSVWRAQQQIRRNGAVVSRYDVSEFALPE
jgi:C1A family cysteine protease